MACSEDQSIDYRVQNTHNKLTLIVQGYEDDL